MKPSRLKIYDSMGGDDGNTESEVGDSGLDDIGGVVDGDGLVVGSDIGADWASVAGEMAAAVAVGGRSSAGFGLGCKMLGELVAYLTKIFCSSASLSDDYQYSKQINRL
jgi:hypothetical protein